MKIHQGHVRVGGSGSIVRGAPALIFLGPLRSARGWRSEIDRSDDCGGVLRREQRRQGGARPASSHAAGNEDERVCAPSFFFISFNLSIGVGKLNPLKSAFVSGAMAERTDGGANAPLEIVNCDNREMIG